MTFLDKLKFWKKDDNLGLKGQDLALGENLGLPPFNQTMDEPMAQDTQSFGMQNVQGYPGQQQQQQYNQYQPQYQQYPQSQQQGAMYQDQQPYLMAKELELISSKLDTIKAAIDSLTQRLNTLEMIMHGNEYKRW